MAGSDPRPVLLRDRLACALCNWIMNHLASPWYRNQIGGAIRYGLTAAARDTQQDTTR